ncbi:MAG TPA: FG-GAP repeat protein [Phycisphaerae bacterium]|nr:FG-GAP repeat protein [Phycisphaerae bacterium]
MSLATLLAATSALPVIADGPATGPRGLSDCNNNGVDDALDIDPADPDGNGEVSPDCDGNLRPDECDIGVEKGLLAPADGEANDEFGTTLAASGQFAIFGATGDDDGGLNAGAAYIYRFDGATWIQEQKLVASDAAQQTFFGKSVAIEGDVAVVSSFLTNGASSAGAYVFRFNGATWIEEQKLVPTGDLLQGGHRVAISGNLIALCVPQGPASNYTGLLIAYQYDGSSWLQMDVLEEPLNSSISYCSSLSLAGDVAVVGARGTDDLTNIPDGRAFVYRFAAGEWQKEATLTAGIIVQDFGYDVAIRGNDIIVGSATIFDAHPGYTFFRYDSGAWIRQLTPSGDFPSATSLSVAVTDDYAAAGYGGFAYSGYTRSGVRVFRRTAQGFEYDKIVYGENIPSGQFLDDIAISGNQLLAADPDLNVHGQRSGGVYVFDLLASYDCNNNLIPDGCELIDNDCDGNGIPDDCQNDCNGNGVTDDCESYIDCNLNRIPDDCELTDNDCNNNGIPDDCETDCNHNGVPDECEALADCDQNGVPDICEIDDSNDCNNNDVLDSCESLAWTFQQRVDAPVGVDFGASISLAIVSPGKFLVGDPEHGQVHVWENVCEWANPQGEAFHTFSGSASLRFGYAVAGRQERLLVGAPQNVGETGGPATLNYYDCAHSDEVFITGFSPQGPSGEFGHAVGFSRVHGASSYDQYAVGAPGDDNEATDAGAVYLFRPEPNGPPLYDYDYVQHQRLSASDASADARFGAGLAIEGNTLAITAPRHSGGGALYVFRLVGETWLEETVITADSTADGGPFGERVSIDRDRIIVGTPPTVTLVPVGSATIPHVFHYDGANWGEETAFDFPTLDPAPDLIRDYGASVSISSGIAATSSSFSFTLSPPMPFPHSGFVDVRRWTGDAWTTDAIIDEPEASGFSDFGRAVALKGSYLAVASADRDAVYLFRRCEPQDLPGDIDADGDVDLDDANALVAVLLDAPLAPGHVARSDLNSDGQENGLDIDAFITALLGP